MRSTGAIALAVAVGVTLAGGTLASASTKIAATNTNCGSDHTVAAAAWYSTPTSTHHYWSGTAFSLNGPGRVGAKNNMDIYVYEGSTLIAHRASPDNLVKYHQYGSDDSRYYLGVYTLRSQSEHVSFKGTFDVTFADPSCVSWTTNI